MSEIIPRVLKLRTMVEVGSHEYWTASQRGEVRVVPRQPGIVGVRILYIENSAAYLSETLREGAFGIVRKYCLPPHLAKELGLPTQVAVKTFKCRSSQRCEVGILPTVHDREYDDIGKEARTLVLLASPYVVQLYGALTFVDHHGQTRMYGLLLELCIGSLEDAITKDQSAARKCLQPLEFCKKLKIAQQCTNAVDYMHSKGFLHRDIKSPNFLVKSDGTIVLTDLATPKAVRGTSIDEFYGPKELRTSHRQRGTITHMPRHLHFNESPQYSTATDVFSLGVMINELMAEKLYVTYFQDTPFEKDLFYATICTPDHLSGTLFKEDQAFPEESNILRKLLLSTWSETTCPSAPPGSPSASAVAKELPCPSASAVAEELEKLIVSSAKTSKKIAEDAVPSTAVAVTQVLSHDQLLHADNTVYETDTQQLLQPPHPQSSTMSAASVPDAPNDTTATADGVSASSASSTSASNSSSNDEESNMSLDTRTTLW